VILSSIQLRQPLSLCFVALLIASSLAGAATFWRIELARHVKRANSSIDVLQAKLLKEASLSVAPPEPKTDFAVSLPAHVSIDPVVRDLQRFSADLGVNFVSLDASSRDATSRTLGRTEMTITLRGEYAKLKSVLVQVLDRYPQLLLQRVAIRRMSGPTNLEANIQLLLLSRPSPAVSG
jgi:hypothetical protein